MNIFTALRQEWHSATPAHLLDAPPTVLKAVDEARSAALAEVLGVHSLREMAGQPLVDWVWRTYSLFRAGAQRDLPADAPEHVDAAWQGRSCGDFLASPLSSLKELPEEARQRLSDAMGWVTVRNMATDSAFAAAREVARIVTGKPVAPEDAIVKPAPNYFGSGTRQFLDKVRAAGGETQKPVRPPPPPPPAPPRAPGRAAGTQAAAQAAAAGDTEATPRELPMEGELAPAVAATLHPDGIAHMPRVPQRLHKDYTPDGAYIPKGGGMRGWVDNQGVARSEQGNRYRYREAVDTQRFKRSHLEDQVRVNNRGAERQELRMQVRWTTDPASPAVTGLSLNLSLTGAKLRVGVNLPEGTQLQATWVHRDDLLGLETPVLQVTARVVWCQPVNPAYRRPRYDCGIQFDPLEMEAQERLTLLLTGRIERLLELGGPQPSAAS
jgi:PilZ domain